MKGKALTRRGFLIGLGVTSISGFFLIKHWPDSLNNKPAKSENSLMPQLKNSIMKGKYGELSTISYETDNDNVLCAFNPPGEVVISVLDGHHTIEMITEKIKNEFNIHEDMALEAKIAHFVAQLAMLGFLKKPFYTTLSYENIETYT